jgi:hypothetical protein
MRPHEQNDPAGGYRIRQGRESGRAWPAHAQPGLVSKQGVTRAAANGTGAKATREVQWP